LCFDFGTRERSKVPDQDLLRILTDLRRKREELDNLKFEIREKPVVEERASNVEEFKNEKQPEAV